MIAIASSTGGPRALRIIVPNLPTDSGAAYVIIQHLPEGFSGPLARDLNNMTALNVRESAEGDRLKPGDLIFARAGYHTIFDKKGDIHLTTDPLYLGVRPSADITMISMVPVFGSRLIGVVLTGMGHDGTDGVRHIKKSGGFNIAEHQSSCVVYGMPRAAFESGCIDKVAPLTSISDVISEAIFRSTISACKQRNAA
ncbi:MAG: CheB methylesterase domain-containing protein [Armatimonadetes bacterium]|nr:CheB methylesterase domain-containing protein [Armatimonadota bacterium]